MPESLIGEVLGICVLLVLSFFFSGAETALTSIRGPKARHIIATQGKRARVLNLWIEQRTQLLTSILVGNNLVNITTSAVATDLAYQIVPSGALAVAIGVTTLLVLVFGEVVPKNLAAHHYEKLAIPALLILRPFHYLVWYTGPSFLLHWLAHRFVSEPDEHAPHDDAYSEEELEFFIDLSARRGTLGKDTEELFQAVFEFDDTTVREIMVPRTEMVAVPVESTLEEVIQAANEAGHSRIPVYEDNVDNVVGVVHVKDLLRSLLEDKDRKLDLGRRVRPPLFVPETRKINAVFKDFKRKKQHMAIVVDEFGGTAGLVTLEDILEELVGEIEDEYDPQTRVKISRDEAGNYVASGRMSIRDLEEELDVEFPEDGDYDTLGGFVTSLSGTVPAKDAEFAWNGLRFKVLDADERSVQQVQICSRGEREEPSAEGGGEDPDAERGADDRIAVAGGDSGP